MTNTPLFFGLFFEKNSSIFALTFFKTAKVLCLQGVLTFSMNGGKEICN
jgi:hypothetical protein